MYVNKGRYMCQQWLIHMLTRFYKCINKGRYMHVSIGIGRRGLSASSKHVLNSIKLHSEVA